MMGHASKFNMQDSTITLPRPSGSAAQLAVVLLLAVPNHTCYQGSKYLHNSTVFEVQHKKERKEKAHCMVPIHLGRGETLLQNSQEERTEHETGPATHIATTSSGFLHRVEKQEMGV